jgi:2-C-methyl-D-erythritol 4-phosphate cytidylyltransferase
MDAIFSVVIVTAAPVGQAAEAGGAFVKVDGREALLRSVELFLNRENIKQIQLVVLPDDLEEAKRKYGPHLSFSGVKLVSGGPGWGAQLAAAEGKILPEATHVIVHDAARPVVAAADIDALLEAAPKEDAVYLAAPVRSELVQIDDAGHPMHHWGADEFMQLLTPQAYSRAKYTSMVKAGGTAPVHAVLLKSSPLNIRIRGGGDASLAKLMLGLLPKPKMKAASNPFDEAQW